MARDASAGLDRFFGVDKSAAPAAERVASMPGDAAYRAGLSEKRAGRWEAAAARFRKAADVGHPAAATELGQAYQEGRGVEQDPKRGARYLAAAATQGDAEAQYLLAKAFANGRGVPEDEAWAARWYGKAARQGQIESQYAYGVLLAAGKGVPSDPVAGTAWLGVAEGRGHEGAGKLREVFAQRLTPEQRGAAEARAAAFKAGPNRRFADPPTVTYVQVSLARLGYAPGPADGYMGPVTRSAIRDYQRSNGLSADGALTPTLLQDLVTRSRR